MSTSVQEPFLGIWYGWAADEDGWATQMDANLQRLGALVQIDVETASHDVGALGAVTTAMRFIVPVAATGAWAGHDKQIAIPDGSGGWKFIVAKRGWLAHVADVDRWFGYDSTGAWTEQTAPTTGSGFPDAPADGKYYLRKDNGWVLASDLPEATNRYFADTHATIADQNAQVLMDSATPVNFVIDDDGTGGLTFGDNITITVTQFNAGQVTLVFGTVGAASVKYTETLKTRKQNATVVAKRLAGSSLWIVSGETEAA